MAGAGTIHNADGIAVGNNSVSRDADAAALAAFDTLALHAPSAPRRWAGSSPLQNALIVLHSASCTTRQPISPFYTV